MPHQNPGVFERGDSAHERHGRNLIFAGLMQRIGLWFIAVAILIGIGFLLWSLLS